MVRNRGWKESMEEQQSGVSLNASRGLCQPLQVASPIYCRPGECVCAENFSPESVWTDFRLHSARRTLQIANPKYASQNYPPLGFARAESAPFLAFCFLLCRGVR